MTEFDKLLKETETMQLAAVEAIKKHFLTVRTGRAHPSLVEGIKVDYYGTKAPLRQLANITTPEARLIVIQPWDRGSLDAIIKAIETSELGVMPVSDGKNLRLTMPQLTHERRDELAKLLHKMAEEGRVSIRNARHQSVEKAEKMEKDHILTEDEKFQAKDRIQKLTDKYIKLIDEALKQKEEEIAK